MADSTPPREIMRLVSKAIDEAEARGLLAKELARFRVVPYSELADRAARGYDEDTCEHVEVIGPSGAEYQIEVQFMWDGLRGETEDVRVMGTIDNGCAPSVVMPLCDDFIMAPDGHFVGE